MEPQIETDRSLCLLSPRVYKVLWLLVTVFTDVDGSPRQMVPQPTSRGIILWQGFAKYASRVLVGNTHCLFSFYEFPSGASESFFHSFSAITEQELVLGRCPYSGVRSRTAVGMGLLSCQGSLRERGRLSVNHVTYVTHF